MLYRVLILLVLNIGITLCLIPLSTSFSAGKEADIGFDEGREKPLCAMDMLLYSWDVGHDVCVDQMGSSPLTQTGMVDFMSGRAVIEAAQCICDKYEQAEQELLQTTRDFHSCKQKEGQSVSSYVLKIKGYIDNLERLGHPMTLGLGTINELHVMLKLHEQTLPKKMLLLFMLFEQIPPPPKREDPAKDSICHECGEIGHWKMNCPQYLAELLKKKKNAASEAGGSGIFVIELNTILNRSWIYDTGCGTHICNTTQGLRANRKLKPRALSFDIPRDGIFEIDLSNSYTNESSIYAVSNKRTKLDLDSTLLWHCRLGLISKKSIEKLQHDGLLNSADLRAFEKCVTCMSRKMARKPYIHQVERAKDLLGLIHTDEVENQLGKAIKSLRSDCRGEYMSQEFLDHLKDHVIIAHRTPPYTPQHNGVSERRNRTLLDMVRSMMSQTTLPKSFWDYALETATRYPKETMSYSFYYPPENKLLVARNAEFLDNSLITQEASESLEDLEIIQEEDTHPSIDTSLNHEEDDQEIDEPQSDINPIRRSTRTRRPTDRMCLYIDAEEHELGDLGEPANYKTALLDLESDKWLNATNVEMQSMKDNEVWVLVERPPNGKTIGIKWLFKKKTDMDEVVHTYKARLVVKGYTQNPGITYEETFSPVADIRAIRILIAIAANTKDMFLVYGGDIKRELRVSCYTDVGYLTDANDLKSQTRYVFILNGGDVDWKSVKQGFSLLYLQKLSILLPLMLLKKPFGLENSFSGLVLFPQLKNT
nr:hypothetical protein [Tanacetum cinerariifolium]